MSTREVNRVSFPRETKEEEAFTRIPPKRSPQGKRFRQLIILVGGLSVNLFFLWLYYHPQSKTLRGDETYYWSIALNIYEGIPPEHHPFWPPLYGDTLGALLRLFGPSPLVVQLTQILMWLGSALMLARVSRVLFRSQAVEDLTLGLFIFAPEFMFYSHALWPEIPHLFFFIATLWLLICKPKTPWTAVLIGICIGFALLLKLVLLYFLPVLLGFYILLTRSKPQILIRTMLAAIACLLLLTPTLLKNRAVHGQAMIADSSLFNIWLGLSDTETADYINDRAGREFRRFQRLDLSFTEKNRLYGGKILALLLSKGLVKTLWDQTQKQFYRLFNHRSFFATQLPGGERAAYHFTNPILVKLMRVYLFTFYAFTLITAVFGGCLLTRRGEYWMTFLLLYLFYSLGIFLLIHVKTRYMIQIWPILTLFSAGLFSAMSRRSRKGLGQSGNGFRARIALGSALSCGVFWLAFRNLFS